MEIINKSDEKLLAEYEQFASTSKYGNFMQSLKWPKVKDKYRLEDHISAVICSLSPVTLTAISVELALS